MRYLRKQIFPTFSYSSIIIFEKMDTVIRVYSLFLLIYRTQNFIIWVKNIIGRSEDTSLKKSRYFEFWQPILMSELDKFGALNLRAESEKVKNNYRTLLYWGDVLKRFYGSPITNAA